MLIKNHLSNLILKVLLLVLGTHSFTLNSDVPIYTLYLLFIESAAARKAIAIQL